MIETITQEEEIVSIAGKDDMNIVEVPFTLLSKRVSEGQKVIETRYHKRIENGQLKECFWRVEGGAEVGLPTFPEEEAFIGLMELTNRQGFRDTRVYTSKSGLLKVINWPHNGHYLSRIELALDRLMAVNIKTNDFWDNEKKCYATISFGIVDGYEFFGTEERRGRRRKSGQQPLPLGFVDWNRILFEKSFQKDYIKNLDTTIYFSLSTPISKRLYRYEDKHFYRGTPFERDLFYLAYEKLGISRNLVYPSNIIQKLSLAIQEHKERNLADIKIKRGKTPSGYKVVFTPITKPQIVMPATAPEAEQLPAEGTKVRSLVDELTSRGVTKRIAATLVRKYPSRIQPKIEVFDWLVKTNSPRVRDNPPGFLRKSIEEDWQPPSGFVSRAERERQTKQAQEQKQQREAREKEALQQEQRKYIQRRAESPWNDLWEQMASELRGMLSQETFSSWIEPTWIADVKEDVVSLSIPNTFFARWIEEHYAECIEGTLSTIREQPTKLRFVCDDDSGPL